MNKKDMKNISRRDFLKLAGAGAAVTGAALAGCRPRNAVSAEGGALGEVPTDKMTYRTNHNTGDRVSLLGYGCMRWPLRQRADGEGEEIDQDAVNELVDYAIAHGVNYFDVAPVYVRGWSEKATGIALKRHPREKFFIATKLSTQRNTPGLRTFEGSRALYEKSFRDLQVDYIDYYLLHSIGNGGLATMLERFYENGMVDFLAKEREAGRIRNLGWSFHGDIKAFDYLLAQQDMGKIRWDFVQIQLNYVDWKYATGNNTPAEYLLGELEKRNIPAVIMEPLRGGRLSRVNAQALKLMKQMHPDDSAAKWAFRYAGTPESVLTVLSGMVYMEHLQENIRTYSPLEPLNEGEYKLLEEVTGIMRDEDYIQCTNCQYCMPCPYGLDIPAVFDHYNRIVSSGQLLKNSNDENYKKARREFLVGYDRSVPKLRQADHCISCKECSPNCPQKLDIPKEMKRVNRYAEQLKQKSEFSEMDPLITLLHEGGYSCVVRNGETRTFSRGGVADLRGLLRDDPGFLAGASLADKVIGVAAAAIIVLGGVKRVWADVMSVPARDFLRGHGVDAGYGQMVDRILNRDRTDSCPLDKLCSGESDPAKMLEKIDAFISGNTQ